MGNRVTSLPPTLRCAFEATGSPSWVMRTIQQRALDRRHGFHLDLAFGHDRGTKERQATEAALVEGAADLIDTDWISLARHREAGIKVAAVFPYGRIMGGLVVTTPSGITDLDGLRGRSIGVVRRDDKNWSVVRGACLLHYGFDPDAEADVDEALSKTTLLAWLESGRVEAALVYWHLVPRLTASGRFRQLYDVLDVLALLGVASPPTSFFICRDELIARQPDMIAGFIAAYREAVTMMRADNAVWRQAAAQMGDSSEVLAGLRTAWCRRVCTEWQSDDLDDLQRLFDRLTSLGGENALGVAAIPAGSFALFPTH